MSSAFIVFKYRVHCCCWFGHRKGWDWSWHPALQKCYYCKNSVPGSLQQQCSMMTACHPSVLCYCWLN